MTLPFCGPFCDPFWGPFCCPVPVRARRAGRPPWRRIRGVRETRQHPLT
jgi:hypothetical protein